MKFHHRRLKRRLHGLTCQGCLFHLMSLHFFLFLPIRVLPNSETGFCDTSMIRGKILLSHCSLSRVESQGRQTDKQSAMKQCAECSSAGARGVCAAEGKSVLTCSEASGDGNCLEKPSEKDFREPLDIFETYKGWKRKH